jgi:hypothetical protein
LRPRRVHPVHEVLPRTQIRGEAGLHVPASDVQRPVQFDGLRAGLCLRLDATFAEARESNAKESQCHHGYRQRIAVSSCRLPSVHIRCTEQQLGRARRVQSRNNQLTQERPWLLQLAVLSIDNATTNAQSSLRRFCRYFLEVKPGLIADGWSDRRDVRKRSRRAHGIPEITSLLTA